MTVYACLTSPVLDRFHDSSKPPKSSLACKSVQMPGNACECQGICLGMHGNASDNCKCRLKWAKLRESLQASVRKNTKVCESAPNFAKVCECLQMCAKMCKCVQKCVNACKSVQMCMKVSKCLQKCAKVRQSARKHTKLRESMQKHAKVIESMRKQAKTCESARK